MKAHILPSILLLALPLFSQNMEPEIHRIRTPEGLRIRAALLSDFDGDGVRDAILALADDERPRRRVLHIHLRNAETRATSDTPSHIVPLSAEVAGYGVMQLGRGVGPSLVVFTASGMFAMELKEERWRPRRLMNTAFLWQSPDDEECFPVESAILDWNGDGLSDCLIPESWGYRVGIQTLDATGAPVFNETAIAIPVSATDLLDGSRQSRRSSGRSRGRALVFRVGIDVGGDDPELLGPLLTIQETVPAPTATDWDGDGMLDLISRNGNELLVWLQSRTSGFPANPTYRFPLPVKADAERQLDVSYSLQVADLNRDGRADALFVAGQLNAEEVRAQVLLYQQGFAAPPPRGTTPDAPLFGPRGLPTQLIPLAGFVGATELVDVDGDGLLDLSLASFRPDAMDAMRDSAKTFDLRWFVFRNRGGTLSQTADLQAEVRLRLSDLDESVRSLGATWIADRDRDSVRELLVQTASRRTVLFGSKREKGRLSLLPEPVWSLETSSSHEVVVPANDADGRIVALKSRTELVILEWRP